MSTTVTSRNRATGTAITSGMGPSGDHASRSSRPRRIARRAGRILVILIVLALLGAVIQMTAERREAAAHPPPGELVELADGRLLHLWVAGEQHDGPTVVLEGGAGASTPAWGWILPAVAEQATVVAYDRAGLGWSDASPNGHDADAVTADLRMALAARGLPGPYVLVGHSLGGHYVRAFAERHPDEVAGVVLVDPSHERQREVMGMSTEDMAPVFAAFRAATRMGLTRIYNPFEGEVPLLPQPQRDQALAELVSVGYARTFAAEMAAVDRIGARLASGSGALGDIPLRVLIAAGGARDEDEQEMLEAMAELRVELAELSSRGEATVVPDATHVGIVTDPVHAPLVTDAISEVLEAVAGG